MSYKIMLTPGLRKRTGHWAYSTGILKRRVFADPMADHFPGGNAIVMHEVGHCENWHGLRSLLWLLLCPFWWPVFRRNAEKEADRWAFVTMGSGEFRLMTRMLGAPTTWWGRWLYTPTEDSRWERARPRSRPSPSAATSPS